ncbi:MAG TPA: hypothetical protein VER03_00125 [Bryobacteraceae bacterium]|nr:hypothetical protein [Bryobacteraceae bacterium]
MLPNFLVEEQAVEKDGEGPVVALEGAAGKALALTLGITDVKEQQSLDVQIFGSADGSEFGTKPLTTFAQQFYKGISTATFDLAPTPEIQYLRARWKVGRWGHSVDAPMFRFYVFAELAPD